jgi:hypothetical protein
MGAINDRLEDLHIKFGALNVVLNCLRLTLHCLRRFGWFCVLLNKSAWKLNTTACYLSLSFFIMNRPVRCVQ